MLNWFGLIDSDDHKTNFRKFDFKIFLYNLV